jgi:coiled-coil and C2 domain-containing protein 1
MYASHFSTFCLFYVVRKTPQSRQEKQLSFLLARQKEFKEAALQAKRKGEMNQAKEYLRLAKGFDPLIEASNSGLPVDMETVSSIKNFVVDDMRVCPKVSRLS